MDGNKNVGDKYIFKDVILELKTKRRMRMQEKGRKIEIKSLEQ